MVDLFRYRHWDLVGKRGLYYIISGLMLLVGLIAWCTVGLNRGIDFRGGGSLTYNIAGSLPESQGTQLSNDISTQLTASGYTGNTVTFSPSKISGIKDQVLVRTLLKGDEKDNYLANESVDVTNIVNTAALKYLPNSSGYPSDTGKKMVVQLDSKEQVSGTISQELTNRGILAAILGSCLILLWIWFRYNIGGLGLKYAVAGIIALGHDLLTLVGMVALLRIEVNAPFVAAVLTVLGYSIHDTIVIFDRIRENMRLRKGRTFAETVNISLLETMARSVNTVATVVFTLLALFFFGGPSLRPFVAAMLIGVTVGGYSSIFIASQLLVSWSKGKDKEILPLGETAPLTPSTKIAPMAKTVIASASVPATPGAATSPTSGGGDAIQRAREAGRTSRRRR